MDRRQRTTHHIKLHDLSPYCRYCGNKVEFGDSSLSHLIPLSQGGSNHHGNLVLCCERCDAAKRDMSLEGWIERLISVLKSINRCHIWDFTLGYAMCTQCRERATEDTFRADCPARKIKLPNALPKLRTFPAGPPHLWQRFKGGRWRCARCGVTKKRSDGGHKPCKGKPPETKPENPQK